MLRAQFAPGTELNWRVRDQLVKAGEYDAAAQCDDPEEAAAHAFTMWEAGELSVAERPVQRLFGVESTVLAGEALHQHFRIFVYQYAHFEILMRCR